MQTSNEDLMTSLNSTNGYFDDPLVGFEERTADPEELLIYCDGHQDVLGHEAPVTMFYTESSSGQSSLMFCKQWVEEQIRERMGS